MRIVVALVLLLAAAVAQSTPVTGQWAGAIQLPSGESLPLVLKITPSPGGELTATITSARQGNVEFTATTFSEVGNTLTLTILPIAATYRAQFNKFGSDVSGTWMQGGRPFPLKMHRQAEPVTSRLPPPPTGAAASLAGWWLGEIRPNGTATRLELHFTPRKGGGWDATLVELNLGTAAVPASRVDQHGADVEVGLERAGGVFQGRLSTDGQTLDGALVQPAVRIPLKLHRTQGPSH